jgi:hypothetical protein
MATKDSADFDPRFDPAFQRGFGGGPTTDAPARAVPRSPAPVPVPAQIGLPPVVSAPVTSDGTISEPQGGPDAAADVDAPTRINPFLIALTTASVLLVAGGLWGVQAAREPFLQTEVSAQADYVGLQMLMEFAPMAIILGLATGLGVLFFLAAGWRRARR